MTGWASFSFALTNDVDLSNRFEFDGDGTTRSGGEAVYLGSNDAIPLNLLHEQADVTITGTVTTSDDNSAIPGVNIVVEGTTVGTTTDPNGHYSLSVPEGEVTLVFSYVGYTTQRIAVNNRTVINISLEPDISTLSEVIVVGYGTQKKSTVTGAISSISEKEMGTLPTVNLSQELQGRASGVIVTNNGAPGVNPLVRIRGLGTINNANPLYVVDGVPVGESTNIDPKDVQSVEILKDASAAAIYGSRAANGVILITTKRAESNKLSVSIDSYAGIQTPWRQLDILNREQYIDYANDLLDGELPERIQNGLDEPIYDGATQTFRQTDTDWQDEMFRSAPIQQHRFEISKGGELSNVYVSGGYFDQDGIMIHTNFKRGNIRVNSDHKLGKRFKIGQTLYVSMDKRRSEDQSGSSIGTNIRYIIASIPYLPVYNPNNVGGFFGPQSVDGSDPTQPVRSQTLNERYYTNNSIFATGYIDFDITDWLSYRFQAGVNINNLIDNSFQPSYDSGPGGYAAKDYSDIVQQKATYVSPVYTNQLTFEKKFGDHFLNVTLVGEKQTSYYNNLLGAGTNSISNQIDIPRGVESPRVDASETEYAILSYVGRINYEYKDKYLIGASFRRDGSSRFAPGNKWGNFPSISAGWRISEESFMQSTPFSELKIRGSYGFVGNNNIGDYAYQATLSNNNYYEFDKTSSIETQGYTIRKLANQDLKWESVEMLNIGLDFALLDNRLTFSGEYFKNTTEDMILPVPLPASMGYDERPLANVGSVENKGIEWQLGYRNSSGSDFQWNISANMSIVRNKVISLGEEGNTIFDANWYGDNITKTEAGQPIAYYYGYEVEGIFQNLAEIAAADGIDGVDSTKYQDYAEPGDLKFKDLNGDGKIDPDDKTKIGKFLPDFTYGINFGANWKNFDATLFIQGVQGNDIFTTVKYHLEGMTRLFNAGTVVLDRWTEEGQDTDVPRAVGGDPNLNSRASTRFVEDGSYLRVKNLTIGYSIPVEILSSWTNNVLTRARFYLSTTNLLTWTKYKSGYDPEVGSFNGTGANASLQNGIDFGQYPQPRTISLGVQLGF